MERVYPLPNVEQSSTRYLAEPQAQWDAMLDIEDRGWEIVAIYHSHPHSAAYPSETDREMAYFSGASYLIVSLANEDNPRMQAFRIAEGNVQPVDLRILDAAAVESDVPEVA